MNEQTRTDWRKFRKSTHLASADIAIMQSEGKSLVFKIKEVRREVQKINGNNTDGEYCYLFGVEKAWKLNSGHKNRIASFAVKNGIPPEDKHVIEYWSGLYVELYVDNNVKFGSDIVDGIRIKPMQPEINKVLPVFSEANFESAKQKNATIEFIKKYYSVTPEIQQKYEQYITA